MLSAPFFAIKAQGLSDFSVIANANAAQSFLAQVVVILPRTFTKIHYSLMVFTYKKRKLKGELGWVIIMLAEMWRGENNRGIPDFPSGLDRKSII
jgi:hypothetical protein